MHWSDRKLKVRVWDSSSPAMDQLPAQAMLACHHLHLPRHHLCQCRHNLHHNNHHDCSAISLHMSGLRPRLGDSWWTKLVDDHLDQNNHLDENNHLDQNNHLDENKNDEKTEHDVDGNSQMINLGERSCAWRGGGSWQTRGGSPGGCSPSPLIGKWSSGHRLLIVRFIQIIDRFTEYLITDYWSTTHDHWFPNLCSFCLDFSLLQGAAFVIEAVCEELEVGPHLDFGGGGGT